MIIENWFKYSLDQLMINAVKLFDKINPNSFCSVRKEIFKFAISHFHAVYQYNGVLFSCEDSGQIFNFLFLTLNELSNLPESIQKILAVINCMIHHDKKALHEFIFLNNKIQTKE